MKLRPAQPRGAKRDVDGLSDRALSTNGPQSARKYIRDGEAKAAPDVRWKRRGQREDARRVCTIGQETRPGDGDTIGGAADRRPRRTAHISNGTYFCEARERPEPCRSPAPPRCTTPPRYQARGSRRMCQMATSEANFLENAV